MSHENVKAKLLWLCQQPRLCMDYDADHPPHPLDMSTDIFFSRYKDFETFFDWILTHYDVAQDFDRDTPLVFYKKLERAKSLFLLDRLKSILIDYLPIVLIKEIHALLVTFDLHNWEHWKLEAIRKELSQVLWPYGVEMSKF